MLERFNEENYRCTQCVYDPCLFYITGGARMRDDIAVTNELRPCAEEAWISIHTDDCSSKLASAVRLCFPRHLLPLGVVNISWRLAGPIALVAPDIAMALRSPRRCVCARRRAAGRAAAQAPAVLVQWMMCPENRLPLLSASNRSMRTVIQLSPLLMQG